MKVGYTEFSFGYAFTENLICSSATAATGTPVFPTLVQEAALGYDRQISFPAVPLFVQYKLPELMVRARASEIANGLCPSLLQAPGVACGARLILDGALVGPSAVRSSLTAENVGANQVHGGAASSNSWATGDWS